MAQDVTGQGERDGYQTESYMYVRGKVSFRHFGKFLTCWCPSCMCARAYEDQGKDASSATSAMGLDAQYEEPTNSMSSMHGPRSFSMTVLPSI